MIAFVFDWVSVGFGVGLGGILGTLWAAKTVAHRIEQGQLHVDPNAGRMFEWPHWLNRLYGDPRKAKR